MSQQMPKEKDTIRQFLLDRFVSRFLSAKDRRHTVRGILWRHQKNCPHKNCQFLSEEEILALCIRLADSAQQLKGTSAFSEAEANQLHLWVAETVVRCTALDLFLDGTFRVKMENGEPAFFLNTQRQKYQKAWEKRRGSIKER